MEAILDAVIRSERGKNEMRRLRRHGRAPAVLYGGGAAGGRQGLALAVDPKAVLRILHLESGVNTLITLKIDGGDSTRVMIKEVQRDPVQHHLLHIDFYRVAMDRTVTVMVPFVVTGEAKGVKQEGGLLDFVHREIEVECLPGDIPGHIEVDVSDLAIGQGIRVRDLARAAGWKPVSEPDGLIVHVVPPRAVEAVEAAPEVVAVAAPAEPEVIKKGKAEKPEGQAEEGEEE